MTTDTKQLRGPALARAVLDHIEDLERRNAAGEQTFAHWDQDEWGYFIEPGKAEDGISCGTSMCFAGWVCALTEQPMKVWSTSSWTPYKGILGLTDGSNIETRAAELLELPTHTDHEGSYADTRLFEGGHDLDRLRDLVAQLEDGTYEEGSWWNM